MGGWAPNTLPYIGWNDGEFVSDSRLFAVLGKTQTFYLVHSHILRPKDPSVITGITYYGEPFVANIEKANIF